MPSLRRARRQRLVRRPAQRPLRTGVVLLGLGIVVSLFGPASAVPVNQVTNVPTRATVTFTGHGFGHGIGMSQYGARGAARAGLSASRILAHYYPGTKLTRVGTPWINIRITKDNDGDVQVAYISGLTVVDRHTNRRITLPASRSTVWRLSGTATRTILSYKANGRWVSYHSSPGRLDFHAPGKAITLITNGGKTRTQYRGYLRASTPTPGSTRRETVNSLPIDLYLQGVVPLEMPASWEPAALRAQAVAARTYAMRLRANPATNYYHLCDTTSCQVYGGSSAQDKRTNAAIAANAGLILTSGGKAALTQFSSSNGGWTAKGSASYLSVKKDRFDTPAVNPNHTWTVRFTDADFERRWPQIGDLRSVTVTDRSGHGDWGGRANLLILRGSRGSVTLTGAQVRSSFGLKSNWFKVTAAAR